MNLQHSARHLLFTYKRAQIGAHWPTIIRIYGGFHLEASPVIAAFPETTEPSFEIAILGLGFWFRWLALEKCRLCGLLNIPGEPCPCHQKNESDKP